MCVVRTFMPCQREMARRGRRARRVRNARNEDMSALVDSAAKLISEIYIRKDRKTTAHLRTHL